LIIIEDNTNIFTTQFSISNNIREVNISINEDFFYKLNISCFNVTQLPMLVKPNSPHENGKYLPYIHHEICHIYKTFYSIVKHKYDIRDKGENQE
jgi:hypothetical protein